MPYPEALVHPMRQELVRLGVLELSDAAAVDSAFSGAEGKTLLLVVNSVCGCAAANARPAVALALQAQNIPDESVTVFAGQDLAATARARTYLPGVPPSSPFIALFSDGDPVYVLERRNIEGRSASAIAMDLVRAFDEFCGGTAPEKSAPDSGESENSEVSPTFRSIL